MEQQKLKEQKAITLVALVITVIVLIILAGVSITLVLSDNGLIAKARKAREQAIIAEKEQEVSIAIMQATMNHEGNQSEITLSEVVDIIKLNYNTAEEKSAISGESTGEIVNKFPAKIIYGNAATGLDKNIEIEIDASLGVKGKSNEADVVNQKDKFSSIPYVDVFKSEYTKVGNIYYYTPDLSGFNPQSTYYVTYSFPEGNTAGVETIAGRIDRVSAPTEGWFDYENKLWANVVTVNDDQITYWTWIPRYVYIADQEAQTVDAKFVKLDGTCTIGDNETYDVSEYRIPDAFSFGTTEDTATPLKGYWITKYEIQLAEANTTERVQATMNGTTLKVTTTNPSGAYRVYIEGIEHKADTMPLEVKDLVPGKNYDICVVSETTGKIIGRTDLSIDNIKVDTSGFNPKNTYYVKYDKSAGTEIIVGRMDVTEEPADWYDYANKWWANLVTVKGNQVTYWTYIPRYEYIAETYNNMQFAKTKFIKASQTKADNGYKIPDAFTFAGKELDGYWITKYEVQLEETSGIEQVIATSDSSGIKVTTTNPSGTYTIFLDGKKYADTQEMECTVPITDGKEHQVMVISETDNRAIGETSVLLSEMNIQVDLSGFNPDVTYYVTTGEDGTGEITIGDKIQVDSEGNATNAPANWYNYRNKIWANIVTINDDEDGNTQTTYWTYIPRYEYIANTYNTIQYTDVRFIPVSQTEPDAGYRIPDAFTFGGKELKGYWVSKYEVQ